MAELINGAVIGQGAQVTVTPTVTAGSYSATWIVGGIITFPNALTRNHADGQTFNAVLESLFIRFKGSVQTTELDFLLFNTSPSNGTYADHGAATWNAADDQYLLGAYALTSVQSPLGTHSIYNLDGIGKQITGLSSSLYGIVVSKAALAASPASASDMTVGLGVIW